MNEIVVLKFGGSSLADNSKLKNAANKIIDFYNKGNKVIVVLSAQGKTTDKLINEAEQLTDNPNKRELDVLLSTGEQISISKLSILLNNMGYNAISLTGWQAGIITTNEYQNARIIDINTARIKEELKNNKIIIIAGFQGINQYNNITTLGRGGSDTSAVAIAKAMNSNECYIFSDVDGIYTADPNKIKNAVKLNEISYDEMIDLSNEGAKVLHNRCVEIAQKYNIPIIARSSFNNNDGTIIKDIIEDKSVKSIIKNDNQCLLLINKINIESQNIYNILINNNINFQEIINEENNYIILLNKNEIEKLKTVFINNHIKTVVKRISKISIIGNSIYYNNDIRNNVIKYLEINKIKILQIQIDEVKFSITCSNYVKDNILNELHEIIFK